MLEETWVINNLFSKPVPVYDDLHSEELSPYDRFESPLAQLCAVPTGPVNGYQGEKGQQLLIAQRSSPSKTLWKASHPSQFSIIS